MTSPWVDIIMPVRDAADTLADALDSILAQSLSAFRLLAIENGSTDAIPDILHTYAEPDALPEAGRCFVVPCVSGRGTRGEIVHELEKRGYQVERDFICAA